MTGRSWRDPSKYIQKIHVDASCVDDPYTREILERANLPWDVVNEGEQPVLLDRPYPESMTEGKRHLYLTRNRGHFFKPCPATREYRCCDYHVLNTGMNCPMDCVYCILQAYLNNPWLSFYVNVDDLLSEIGNVLRTNPDTRYRIGTGEFTDSLAIDRLTRLSTYLVPYMAKQENAMLELKTKSAVIENLEHLEHRGRTVISWSLNSSQALQQEELRVANLEERLAAAAQCARWGYRLGFHFDPIIEHEGWQEGYRATIEALYRTVPAEAIVWISMGALRYLPKLKDIGMHRFPGTTMYFQEFVEGLDGKSRYFRHSRTKLYSSIYQMLKRHAADSTCIYFCMESDEIWREVMGYIPEEKGGVPALLERAFFEGIGNR
ncbi:SPL family radical SAM protein [Desulfopila aestuarii]|uniref:Spore photoproduct lyase n=1 Tax=Desulfopila aestuarii DSM 18488 TaxID=1121416 RepID=A0A1M7Y3U2_9BACT|nr:DNA photolyase [Desulfopila aestuarii]SHO46896.1 spore photoproduct lyase [Desulfopila aestuarii DSM 18488]